VRKTSPLAERFLSPKCLERFHHRNGDDASGVKRGAKSSHTKCVVG